MDSKSAAGSSGLVVADIFDVVDLCSRVNMESVYVKSVRGNRA